MNTLRFEEGSVQPKYESYCISNVTSTLLSILGIENGRTKLPSDVFDGVDTTGVQNVVLFVFDGFGYNEWARQTGEAFFGRMAAKGRTTRVTSVFPSTTSTALTTLTTTLTPQEHSLIEWFMYLPEADMIIQTLPFSPMGSRGASILSKIDPSILVTGRSIFPGLVWEEVGAHSYLSRYIARSAYTEMMHTGSEIHPYTDSSDLAVMLRKKLEAETAASFHYVYMSSVDTIEHLYGPGSEEAYIEAASLSGSLKKGLLDKLDEKTASRTLFVITADHGHVYSSMENTMWLSNYPSLVDAFPKGWSERPVLPWGAPRDVYLLVRDELLDDICGFLQDELAGRAMVVKTRDAVSSGIFGVGSPNPVFLERVGNLMVLPNDKRTAWYHHPDVERLELTGQHGGMHPDEMTLPLSVARASSVVS